MQTAPAGDETMRALAAALGPALPTGAQADIVPLDAELLELVRHAGVEVSASGRDQ